MVEEEEAEITTEVVNTAVEAEEEAETETEEAEEEGGTTDATVTLWARPKGGLLLPRVPSP